MNPENVCIALTWSGVGVLQRAYIHAYLQLRMRLLLKPSQFTSRYCIMYIETNAIFEIFWKIQHQDWYVRLLLIGLFYNPPDGALIGETNLPHSCKWWRGLVCPAKGPKCTSDDDCPGQSQCCLHTCGAYCTSRIPPDEGNKLQQDWLKFSDFSDIQIKGDSWGHFTFYGNDVRGNFLWT